ETKSPAPPKPADATEPGPFVAPRLSLSDSTIERLAVLLEVRPQGLAFVADELARLFLNMKRYSNGQDNEFWLEAWDAKHFVVERQGRPPVVLDYLLVGSLAASSRTSLLGLSRAMTMVCTRGSALHGRKNRSTCRFPTRLPKLSLKFRTH